MTTEPGQQTLGGERQTTLHEVDGDDPEACLNCGLDAETTTLETRDGMPLCVADADAYDRGMLTEAEIRGDRDGE